MRSVKKGLCASLGFLGTCLLLTGPAAAVTQQVAGFQTFSNAGGNNNSGINDSTPDSNSTYDATPVGTIGAGNTYLNVAIGPNASANGRKGRGQQTNKAFLNGPEFGNPATTGVPIIDVTLANGDPGQRIGARGTTPAGAPNGTSAWKFSSSNNERQGDFRLTNASDYYFKLDFIHFDARVGNANSPDTLTITYLAGNGTAFDNALTKKTTGAELVNGVSVYSETYTGFGGTETAQVSRNVGAAVSSQVYLAPGASAGFRITWTGFATAGAESQIDNLALEGAFFTDASLSLGINPAQVPEPTTALLLGLGLLGLGVTGRKRA